MQRASARSAGSATLWLPAAEPLLARPKVSPGVPPQLVEAWPQVVDGEVIGRPEDALRKPASWRRIPRRSARQRRQSPTRGPIPRTRLTLPVVYVSSSDLIKVPFSRADRDRTPKAPAAEAVGR
jgi:hypothetical protein